MIGWLSGTFNPARNWSFGGFIVKPEQAERQ
jgi:hypothetical protein